MGRYGEWAAVRALRPTQFPDIVFGQLHLQVEARHWREGDEQDPLEVPPGQ